MNAIDLLRDLFDRVKTDVHGAVEGLDEAAVTHRVDGGANSIAWLVWHLTRVQGGSRRRRRGRRAGLDGAGLGHAVRAPLRRGGHRIRAEQRRHRRGARGRRPAAGVLRRRARADTAVPRRDRRGRPGQDRRSPVGSPGHARRPPGQRRGRRHPACRAGGVKSGESSRTTGNSPRAPVLTPLARAIAPSCLPTIRAWATPARARAWTGRTVTCVGCSTTTPISVPPR